MHYFIHTETMVTACVKKGTFGIKIFKCSVCGKVTEIKSKLSNIADDPNISFKGRHGKVPYWYSDTV